MRSGGLRKRKRLVKRYTCSFNLEIAVWFLKQASRYLNHSLRTCVFCFSGLWPAEWTRPASPVLSRLLFWRRQFFFLVGGGRFGFRCLGPFKANSCLPEYFQVWTLQGGVLAWLCGHIPSAAAPPLRFGGAEGEWFPHHLLPSSPSLGIVGGFTPNLSLSGACLHFSAMSDTSKTR